MSKTTKTAKISKTMDRALGLAAEYRRYVDIGDVVLAEQTRRTIEDLVGRPVGGGKVTFPRSVAAAMGQG